MGTLVPVQTGHGDLTVHGPHPLALTSGGSGREADGTPPTGMLSCVLFSFFLFKTILDYVAVTYLVRKYQRIKHVVYLAHVSNLTL